MEKFYYYLFNLFFRFFTFAFRWRFFYRFLYVIIAIILILIRYRNSVLEQNLQIAFGNNLSKKQRAKLKKKIYWFLSYETCYFISLANSNPLKLKKITKIIADPEVIALCQKQTPLILLSGHTLGVWIGALFSTCFRRCFAYTYHGPQKDSYEIYNLFQKISKKFSITVIPQSQTDIFTMRRCLKNNHCLSIVGDFNVQHTNTFVNFFGKPATIGEGSFRLALRTKTPIVFGHITEDDNKQILFSLKKIYDPTETPIPTIAELAIRFSNELEKKIIQKPHCYFWSNKRWKTRPKGDTQQIYVK